MNVIIKNHSSSIFSQCLKRHLNLSSVLYNRRPPSYLTKLKSKIFPFFQLYYDKDMAGPHKVVIDRLNNYPPGNWGSMPIKNSWKRYDEMMHLQSIPSYFDKLISMSWTEYNMYYHTIDVPMRFPETLDFAQFLTRTKIAYSIPDSIKDSFNDISADSIKSAAELLKLQIDNYFSQNRPYLTSYDVENHKYRSNDFITQLMGSIMRSKIDRQVFENYSVSPTSKIETFIKRSCYDELNVVEHIKNAEGCIQYRMRGELAFQLRSRDPLKEFVNKADSLFIDDGSQFPIYNYHPKTFDMEEKDFYTFQNVPFAHQRASSDFIRNIPGFWGTNHIRSGDPCGFSVLGVINTNLSQRSLMNFSQDHPAIVHRYYLSEALLSSFIWTMAQAQNQGFTIYDEITYPICTAMLLTDGCHFQMVYFQLNSISALWKPKDAGLPVNMMWVSPPTFLFKLNESNQVEQVNEHALHQLLAAMSLPRSAMTTEELQPYLKTPAPRDIAKFMIDFNPETATEKEIEKYRLITKIRPLTPFSKHHPNYLFYFDMHSSITMNQTFRKIVPTAQNVPDFIDEKMALYHLRTVQKIGKKKLMRYPSKWQ